MIIPPSVERVSWQPNAGELESVGFDVALYPTTGQKGTAKAIEAVYAAIFEEGTQAGVLDRLAT